MDNDAFQSFRQSGMFNSVYQSFKKTSMILNSSLLGSESKPDSAISSLKSVEAFEHLKSDFMDSSLDIEFKWQGLFVGLLKAHRFDTDNLFNWISTLEPGQSLNFSETLYSHFLLRSENFKLTYIDSQKEKEVTIGSFEVVDCISSDQNKKKTHNEEEAFGDRVDIQGLDMDSMNMSMSFDNSAFFKSIQPYDPVAHGIPCKEMVLLRIEPAAVEKLSQTLPAIKVKLDLGPILQVGIHIHKISVDFDLESFKMMADRKAMYEEIYQICNLISYEKKRGETESHKLNEARLLYEGVTSITLEKTLSSLEKVYQALKVDDLRNQLLKELQIVLPHTLTQAQSSKIEVNITNFEAKVGGKIDVSTGNSVHLLLKMGCIKVLMQKMILVSWSQPIEASIKTESGQYTILKVTGEKENLVAIDDGNLMTKISSVDVQVSPAIFEGILLLVQFMSTKLERLEFNHQKYQIVKSLLGLMNLHQDSYSLFKEEGEINKLVKAIDQLVFSGPTLITRTYIYVGRVDLKIFDEEITRDIIESSIAQRKRMLDEFDDWTVVEEDKSERPYQQNLEEDIEKKEKILKTLNVVIHLELKPIMINQKLGPNPTLLFFIHTIMLLDGLTYISMKENRLNYPTHFCELYSINYNQPSYDANLGKKFEINQCISAFKQVLKKFKQEKAFLEVTQVLDFDPESNRMIQKTKMEVSSIVFRMAMKTSKETFACLIRILDSTLLRLDNISVLFMQLRDANTTDEMKIFHRMQSQKQSNQANARAQENGTHFEINFDCIYLDIFYEGNYRLLFKVTSTNISIDDNPFRNQPIQIECNSVQASFAQNQEYTKSKDVEIMKDKTKFFKVFNLQTMIVKITQPNEGATSVTEIEVSLPNKGKRNLLIMLDLESLAVIRELSDTFSSLIEHSKSKTKFIFKDYTEYKNKPPETPCRKDRDGWEKVGHNFTEITTIRDHFRYLADKLTESFQLDDEDNDGKDSETSAATLADSKRKMDSTLQVLREIFIEKLPEKVSNLNLKVFIDKITVNIYQNFDPVCHSYVSLKIAKLFSVTNINSSSLETSRKSDKTFTTTSSMLSVRSIKVLDKTANSLFTYLLKIPHHSLCMFFRNRVVSEKSVKGGIELYKPTYLVESFTDHLAFVLELNPIQIYLDDKSVSSLKAFTDKLLVILKSDPIEDNTTISEKKSEGKKPEEVESNFLLDYILIGSLSLQLQLRSSTNLSVVNFVPDININLEVFFF